MILRLKWNCRFRSQCLYSLRTLPFHLPITPGWLDCNDTTHQKPNNQTKHIKSRCQCIHDALRSWLCKLPPEMVKDAVDAVHYSSRYKIRITRNTTLHADSITKYSDGGRCSLNRNIILKLAGTIMLYNLLKRGWNSMCSPQLHLLASNISCRQSLNIRH